MHQTPAVSRLGENSVERLQKVQNASKRVTQTATKRGPPEAMGKSALNSILIYGAANRFTFVQNHSRTLLYNLWVITYFLKITSTAWVQIFATQWGPRLNRGSVLPNFITEGSYSLLARFFSCGTTEEKFYRVQSSRTE